MNKAILYIGGALAAFFLLTKAKGGKDADSPGDEAGGGTTDLPPAPAGGNVAPVGEELTKQATEGLRAIVSTYGRDIADKVEQIYRLETANFTSGGFAKTNTPGMKAPTSAYPFGWKKRGTIPSDFLPVVNMVDTGEGAASNWVVFKKLPVAMMYVATFLNDYSGNVGRWNTTDPAGQQNYAAKVQRMAHTLTDKA